MPRREDDDVARRPVAVNSRTLILAGGFALAVLAVVLSAAAVAGLGVALAGLPLYAAFALGAIVAPPDAAEPRPSSAASACRAGLSRC